VKKLAYIILLILVLLSLALNVLVLSTLWTAKESITMALDQTLETLAGLEGEKFETTVYVQESIPVHIQVPFQRELVVPVNLEVPISDAIVIQETFEVPINTPLFDFTVDIPVSSTIPVELVVPVKGEVPVLISETIPVDTDVEINLSVPFAIEMADTPLPGYLEQLRAMVEQMRQQLSLETGPWQIFAPLLEGKDQD
jgi:hypothetical protein